MDKQEIKNWLKEYKITNYRIRPNLVVDVNGDVKLYCNELEFLPFQFGKVSGHFDCSINNLASLQHCPTNVGGDFNCRVNKLTSLQYYPIKVGGNFYCGFNKLISLQYCPTNVGGDFYHDTLKLADFGKTTVSTHSTCDGMELLKEEYMQLFVSGGVYGVSFKEWIDKKLT